MATEPIKLYPHGSIAMDNGDLFDVQNIKISTTNNAKQVHTLRQKGSGYTMGTEESNVSFDSVVSEDGPERNYLRMVKTGEIKQLRIKIPGETITINGIHQMRDIDIPLDDAIKMSVTFIGAVED